MTTLQKVSEADVQRTIVDYFSNRKFLVVRLNSGAAAGEYTDRHGTTRRRLIRFTALNDPTLAISDLLLISPDGDVAWLEVKKPDWKPPKPPAAGKPPSEDYQRYCRQQDFLSEMHCRGHRAGFVTSLEAARAIVGV